MYRVEPVWAHRTNWALPPRVDIQSGQRAIDDRARDELTATGEHHVALIGNVRPLGTPRWSDVPDLGGAGLGARHHLAPIAREGHPGDHTILRGQRHKL